MKVADGDTVTVLRGKEQVRIRLAGVDTPEKRQAFGQKAKQFTLGLVAGKEVEIRPKTIDRYGRTVGKIIVNGESLNKALVAAGLAWWYRKYSPGEKELGRLEAEARDARRGLWADPKPQAPWDWRRAQRGSGRGKHRGRAQLKPPGQGAGEYHGNRKSGALHGSGCQHYDCKSCTALFKTVQAAKDAGYRPHQACIK